MINTTLKNTSNTCVLIGTETYKRPWVRYEIFKSFVRGNHIFGVHINGIRDKNKQTKNLGNNPFEYLGYRYNDSGTHITFFEYVNGKWIEYSSVDNKSTFKLTTPKPLKKNKFVELSEVHKTYLWNKDKGYENFGTWVK